MHYYFLSPEQFAAHVADGDFLEHAMVHGRHHYGTLRAPVERLLDEGVHVILEIDLQGARQVRETMPNARLVFLAPPSWEELQRRLIGRGTESAEEQSRRLATARIELAAENEFDHTIINDEVERATDELVRIITSGR